MIDVLLHCIHFEAPDIVSLEFSAPGLPRYAPGAHIDLHLPNSLIRSYSLLPPRPEAPTHYRVAVLNAPGGRGGSACVHDALRVGQILRISTPRNNFPCDLGAEHSVLVAGGIGITPLYAMAKALTTAGRAVELIYCARSHTRAAFLKELGSLHGLQVTTWFDDEHDGPPDLTALLAERGAETRFYACGPGPMLTAFEAACSALGYHHATLERFAAASPSTLPLATGGFNVILQRSSRTLTIPAEQSILEVLLAEGIPCDYSCTEGLCGACETKVLGGKPEHRDSVLTEKERAGNAKMMICVSRCAEGPLVLDY
jgi:tetrachlorobenzoquinone reductase